MSWWIWALIWFAIPLIATVISGRRYSLLGHAFFFLLWPIAWMFVSEELP